MGIPEELVVDIAANLPIKSLLRFRSVSTSWSALFGKSSFTFLHTQISKTKTKIIINSPHRPNSFNVVSRSNVGPYQHVTCPVAIRRDDNSTFTIVDSCDGLVCVTSTASGRQLIHICNPVTRESRFVPPRIHTGHSNNLRFVSDAANNDYNIVSVGSAVQIQIYSLQADRWRLADGVQVPESLRWDINNNNNNFNMLITGGIPSWLIKGRNMIVTFDVTTLSFHETILPDFGRHGYLPEVLTLDGSLAVLARRDIHTPNYDVWVLGEIGVKESWSKRFCIKGNVITTPLGFWSDYGLVCKGSASACFTMNDELDVYVFGEERVKSLEILGGLSQNWGQWKNVQVVNYKETLILPKMSLKRKSAC